MLTNLPDVSVARENAVRFMSSTSFNGQACNVHDIYFDPQANKYYVGKWKSQFKGRLNSGTGKILQYLAQHIDEKIWEGELQLVTGWKNPRFQIQDLRSQMHVSSYYSIHARQDPFDIIYISLNRDKGR